MPYGRRYFRFAEGAITPAYDGIDSDASPDQLAPTKAPRVENFLVDRPGQLLMRGPINEATAFIGSTGVKPIQAWVFNNNLLIGMKATQAGNAREPWVAPYRKAAVAGDLAVMSTSAFHVSLDTGVVTTVTVAADTAPGFGHARVGDFTYGLGFDAAAGAVSLNGGYQKLRKLLRWDGSAAVPTAYANGPLGAQAVIAHNQKVFAAGGYKPGTTTYSPNSLWWTDDGGPTTDTLAFWQDDVTGLTNEIIVGENDASDFIVGLGKVGQNMAIFKRHSIHVLYGYSSSTYLVKTFSLEQGCLDPRSIVQYEDGCFFMSDQGYMFFDGSQLSNTIAWPGGGLRSTLLKEALIAAGDGQTVDGGRVSAGRLPNGYLGVSIGQSPASSVDSSTAHSCLYHVPRKAWVYLSSDALIGSKPTMFGRSQGRSFLVDDQHVVQANKMLSPESAPASERGIDTLPVLFTFDATGAGPTFNGAGNTLRNQLTGIEMFPGGAAQYSIKSVFQSRLQQLAEPYSLSQLQRFRLDYAFKVVGAADDAALGWYVSLINGAGSTLEPEYQVPAQGDPSTYGYRRQHTKDTFNETMDLQLLVQWKGPALAVSQAAIFAGALEFIPGRQRRST